MNYDDQVSVLGESRVKAIERLVKLTSTELKDGVGALALCELLVDMISIVICRADKDHDIDALAMTCNIAKQLHVLVPSMQEGSLQTGFECVSMQPGGGWRFPPLVPQRLGQPMSDQHAYWVQDLVEEIDALLIGKPATVLGEVAARFLANYVLVQIREENPADLAIEDVLGRALEALWSWGAMTDLPPKESVAR